MLLEVKDLNTYYGSSHVLQGISLNIAQSEIIALLGRNGMGKSTILKSIMGLVKPKSGSIRYQGRNLIGSPPYKVARAGVGYVPEERRIFPNLSVMQNLSIGLKAGESGEAVNENDWTMERFFERFPILKRRRNHKGALLSGGEQQMLAIGRTLMGNPRLLLVDEPTEGLAPTLAKEVRDVLDEIRRTGVSILLVEHNLQVAMSLADRVYLMAKAFVAFTGTVKELDSQPEIRRKYLEV